MATWDQRDERWIVEDREDGTNVNQWHWTEKDCMNWCRQKLTELFEGASLVDDAGVKATVTSVDKLEGEAFLNVRKKKIIPSYELELVLKFQASVGEDTVSGKVCQRNMLTLPCVSSLDCVV
jgi:activator of HSP90 ATPase